MEIQDNISKARELALAYQQEDDGHIEQIIREDALEEMAAWKDQQFKEYLEKKYKEASDSYDKTEAKFYEDRMDYINEIINELFGE